jgi:putative membrane protein (TIGR04086 family)
MLLANNGGCAMKINWGRVINAGLIAEILLFLPYEFALQIYGRGLVTTLIVRVGCFIFMLIGALWVGRKIESRFVLHGFLVGVVAIAYYVIQSLPSVYSGEYPVNYWSAALYGHTPKLLGGLVGGYIAVKLKKKNALADQ